MKNFRVVQTDINPTPLLGQVAAHPELWNVDDSWSSAKGPNCVLYSQDNIVLRNIAPPTPRGQQPRYDRPAFSVLTEAQSIVFALMTAVRGEALGKVVITKMPPGDSIAPHIDFMPFIDPAMPWLGRYPVFYQRYQVPLISEEGVIFRVGTEIEQLDVGKAYWFQNQAEHEVCNESPVDRLSMVVDIRPFNPNNGAS